MLLLQILLSDVISFQVNGLQWIYLQYCLVTGLYMLEPWERKLFTTVAVLSVSVFVALTISAGGVVFA